MKAAATLAIIFAVVGAVDVEFWSDKPDDGQGLPEIYGLIPKGDVPAGGFPVCQFDTLMNAIGWSSRF